MHVHARVISPLLRCISKIRRGVSQSEATIFTTGLSVFLWDKIALIVFCFPALFFTWMLEETGLGQRAVQRLRAGCHRKAVRDLTISCDLRPASDEAGCVFCDVARGRQRRDLLFVDEQVARLTSPCRTTPASRRWPLPVS